MQENRISIECDKKRLYSLLLRELSNSSLLFPTSRMVQQQTRHNIEGAIAEGCASSQSATCSTNPVPVHILPLEHLSYQHRQQQEQAHKQPLQQAPLSMRSHKVVLDLLHLQEHLLQRCDGILQNMKSPKQSFAIHHS